MLDRGIKLVQLLIDHLNSNDGSDYRITAFPEQDDHSGKAVEAIATNSRGDSVAFEHTLIQPFVGDKADAQPLLKAFAPLEADPECKLDECDITVLVPVAAVQKGIKWAELANGLKAWLRSNKEVLPEGRSEHLISKLQPDLEISVWKTPLPGLPGKVFVGRTNMPEDFPMVIRTALRKKLPKLAAASAGRRVLLLEKDSPPHGYSEIAKEIEQASAEFSELQRIDAIWVVNTVAWETEGYYDFKPIWPQALRGDPV
jgi:hypothetical protein